MTPSAHDAARPRVIEEDAPATAERPFRAGPAVFATDATERIVPPQQALAVPARAAPVVRRRDKWVRLGLWGLGIGIAGWIAADTYIWIADAFARSATFGWLATALVTLAVGGAALVTGREVKTFLALRRVEDNQQRFEQGAALTPAQMRDAIRVVLAAVPKDRESEAAIEAYQRQAQVHHTPAQQIEMLSRTVMRPLDRRAEAVVRRATGRAFAITAISPTALIDTILFIAMSVRMVRGIAASYGHRPTAAATWHLMRRLVTEAGRLGAVDLAGMTLSQHLGGAIAERIATGAAESMYAGQRMARIGLITMGMCRPVPFRTEEAPGIFSSLLGGFRASREPGETSPQGLADR